MNVAVESRTQYRHNPCNPCQVQPCCPAHSCFRCTGLQAQQYYKSATRQCTSQRIVSALGGLTLCTLGGLPLCILGGIPLCILGWMPLCILVGYPSVYRVGYPSVYWFGYPSVYWVGCLSVYWVGYPSVYWWATISGVAWVECPNAVWCSFLLLLLSGESEAGYSRLTGARFKDLEGIQVSAGDNNTCTYVSLCAYNAAHCVSYEVSLCICVCVCVCPDDYCCGSSLAWTIIE